VEQGSPKLDNLLHPSSIAIIGASADPTSKGYDYLKGIMEFDFGGELYPVNPKGGEILGLKAYPSVKDIPGTIDYVISCIPAQPTIELIEDCAIKGAKVLQLFAAGFSETGEEEGRKLEEELVQKAQKRGIRVIGPNCIGVHYPKGGLAFARAKFSKRSGPVGCLVQSGGHAWTLVSNGSLRGISFSKVISFGNACDLNESDFLECLANDPETEVITAYVEGIKNGPRFINAAKKAAQAKPVIMFKGGRTEAGRRATVSHTGALAGQDLIWDALFHQARVIRVYSLDELIDTVLPFIYFPEIKSPNVGIVGAGGGASVQAADECESKGLLVPPLPPELRHRLKEFTPLVGSSLGNPVDTVEIWNPQHFIRTLELVATWDGIDLLIAHAVIEIAAQWQGQSVLDGIIDALLTTAKGLSKPMAVVLQSFGTPRGLNMLYSIQKRFVQAGIPVYPTVARAANAMSKFIEYHNRSKDD
jgi:acyl-CoA synthetase (NDP forming)